MVDVTVINAHGIPDKAHLSFKIGDVRRQMQYKAPLLAAELVSAVKQDMFSNAFATNLVKASIRSFGSNPNPLKGFSQDLLNWRGSPSKPAHGRFLRGTSQIEKILRKTSQIVRVLARGPKYLEQSANKLI